MKAILFPIILSLSAAGGVFTADMVRAPGGAEIESAPDGKAAQNADKAAHGASEKSDHANGSDEAVETEFLRFKRQFVVPVVKNNDVEALVLLNIALEVTTRDREEMFRLEPRFRDAFIRELLNLSDTGYFDASLTSPSTYEAMRETLLRAARNVSVKGVEDVLILDLTRQDN